MQADAERLAQILNISKQYSQQLIEIYNGNMEQIIEEAFTQGLVEQDPYMQQEVYNNQVVEQQHQVQEIDLHQQELIQAFLDSEQILKVNSKINNIFKMWFVKKHRQFYRRNNQFSKITDQVLKFMVCDNLEYRIKLFLNNQTAYLRTKSINLTLQNLRRIMQWKFQTFEVQNLTFTQIFQSDSYLAYQIYKNDEEKLIDLRVQNGSTISLIDLQQMEMYAQFNSKYIRFELITQIAGKRQEVLINFDGKARFQELFQFIKEITKRDINDLRVLSQADNQISLITENYRNSYIKDQIVDKSKIYIESKDANYVWFNEINKNQQNFIVKFNVPKQYNMGPHKYDQEIIINPELLAHQIRYQIAQQLNLPQENFIIKINGENGSELRE